VQDGFGKLNATVTSNICPAGSYCPTGSAAPLQCPVGTYVGTTGTPVLNNCIVCSDVSAYTTASILVFACVLLYLREASVVHSNFVAVSEWQSLMLTQSPMSSRQNGTPHSALLNILRSTHCSVHQLLLFTTAHAGQVLRDSRTDSANRAVQCRLLLSQRGSLSSTHNRHQH
jgi:hypothetical protein